jgi:hypothetical protein
MGARTFGSALFLPSASDGECEGQKVKASSRSQETLLHPFGIMFPCGVRRDRRVTERLLDHGWTQALEN